MGRLRRILRRVRRHRRSALIVRVMTNSPLCIVFSQIIYAAVMMSRYAIWQSATPSIWISKAFIFFVLCNIVAMIILAAITLWARRVVHRRVLGANGRLCPSCMYDLRAIGESGRCPECGTRYRARWLWRRWNQIFPRSLIPRHAELAECFAEISSPKPRGGPA